MIEYFPHDSRPYNQNKTLKINLLNTLVSET